MVVLKSIDLFTGVGGITLALSGIARPVAYCEIDPVARECIAANMRRGALPRAPVHDDVTTLVAPPKADIVVGGVPCIGWSTVGKREGLDNDKSALFFSMLRVIDTSGARAVFIENVPGIANDSDRIVRELSVKRKFELRWTVVRALDVGAPHQRARWFCLGVRAGSRIHGARISCRKYEPFEWGKRGQPPRTCGRTRVTSDMQTRLDARCALMGNSVVPDAVRLAFLRLFTAGSYTSLRDRPGTLLRFELDPPVSTPVSVGAQSSSVTVVARGTSKAESVTSKAGPATDAAGPRDKHHDNKNNISTNKTGRPGFGLCLDPRLVEPPASRSPMQTTEALKRPIAIIAWATPRHGMLRACRVLTRRSAKDLPTQIRFEKRTRARNAPMSAAFVEWMMGYPPGFTDIAGDGM